MAKIPHMNYPYISQDVVIIQEGQPGQVSPTVQVTERSWLFDPEEFDIIEIPPSQDHHVHASLEDQGGITIDQIEFGSGEYLEFGPLARSSPQSQNLEGVWGDEPPPSPINPEPLPLDMTGNWVSPAGHGLKPTHCLNETYKIEPGRNNTFIISDNLEGPAAQGLNETCRIPQTYPDHEMNQTFNVPPQALNQTFNVPPQPLNQTFNVPPQALDQTFTVPPRPLNQTFNVPPGQAPPGSNIFSEAAPWETPMRRINQNICPRALFDDVEREEITGRREDRFQRATDRVARRNRRAGSGRGAEPQDSSGPARETPTSLRGRQGCMRI